MIKPDPLTPCSAGDYMRRLRAAFLELDAADRAFCRAWNERNDASWPRGSTCLKDMVPRDDPGLLAAEAKVEEARAAWRAAHAKYASFVGAPLELVCAVEDYRVSARAGATDCTLPAAHDGRHSWEAEQTKPAAPPVSNGGEP